MTPRRRIQVWDVVVRLLHWALAVLVAVDLLRDDGDRAHRLVGYAAVVVVLLRLGWAAVVRSHASLAGLRPSVSQSWVYLRLVLRGQPPRSLGHNPLGLWMVWLLWILVLRRLVGRRARARPSRLPGQPAARCRRSAPGGRGDDELVVEGEPGGGDGHRLQARRPTQEPHAGRDRTGPVAATR